MGGTWILPIRDAITVTELAFILEVPPGTVRELLEESSCDDEVELRKANELLSDLAGCGFTDWTESSLFGEVIAGRQAIDSAGRVWLSVAGRPAAPQPSETRSAAPPDGVNLDLERFNACRERRRAKKPAGRV